MPIANEWGNYFNCYLEMKKEVKSEMVVHALIPAIIKIRGHKVWIQYRLYS